MAEESKKPKEAILRPRCYGKRKTDAEKCYTCLLIESCSKDTLSVALAGQPVHIVGP
jgi:hypothetical protein